MVKPEDNDDSWPKSQNELDTMICDIMRSKDDKIPRNVEYVKYGRENINTAWGVAVTGVMLFNGISGEGVDPFYPAKYGRVTDPE